MFAEARVSRDRLLRDQVVMIAFTTFANAVATAFQFVMARIMTATVWTDTFVVLALLTLLAVPSGAVNTLAVKMTGELYVRGEVLGMRRWVIRALLRAGGAAGVVGVVLAIASPWLASVLKIESPVSIFAVAIALVVIMALAVVKGTLAGVSAFTALGAVTVGETSGRLVFAVVMVLVGFGAAGAVGGSAFGAAIALAVGLLVVRAVVPLASPSAPITDADLPEAPDQSRIMAISLALAVMFNADILVVNNVFSADEAASYSAMALIGRSLFFVASPVATVVLPHTIRAMARGVTVLPILMMSVGLILAIVLGTSLVLLLFASQIFDLIFGDGYTLDLTVMTLYVAAGSLLAVTFTMAQILIGAGRLRIWVVMVAGALMMVVAMATLGNGLVHVASILVVTLGLACAYLGMETLLEVRHEQAG